MPVHSIYGYACVLDVLCSTCFHFSPKWFSLGEMMHIKEDAHEEKKSIQTEEGLRKW